MKPLTSTDYPISETRPDQVLGPRGMTLQDITLEAVIAGDAEIEDLRISRESLLAQAGIARATGRETLALNFERGAELIDVPQDVIMQTYEMLRPGRVEAQSDLLRQAALLRDTYGASEVAAFIERAAEVYLQRGLLKQ